MEPDEIEAVKQLMELAHLVAYDLPTKSRLALGPSVLAQARRAVEAAEEVLGGLDEPLPRMLRG